MLAALELLGLVFFCFLFHSQIILPIYRGTRLFPLFRAEQGLSIRLAEERQRLIEKKMQQDIKRLKEKK